MYPFFVIVDLYIYTAFQFLWVNLTKLILDYLTYSQVLPIQSLHFTYETFTFQFIIRKMPIISIHNEKAVMLKCTA